MPPFRPQWLLANYVLAVWLPPLLSWVVTGDDGLGGIMALHAACSFPILLVPAYVVVWAVLGMVRDGWDSVVVRLLPLWVWLIVLLGASVDSTRVDNRLTCLVPDSPLQTARILDYASHTSFGSGSWVVVHFRVDPSEVDALLSSRPYRHASEDGAPLSERLAMGILHHLSSPPEVRQWSIFTQDGPIGFTDVFLLGRTHREGEFVGICDLPR